MPETHNYYSFATNYCSWRRPDVYPIWDGNVDKAFWFYKKNYAFHDFRRKHLWSYGKFLDIMTAFRAQFGLDSLTFKQIDAFLWHMGDRI